MSSFCCLSTCMIHDMFMRYDVVSSKHHFFENPAAWTRPRLWPSPRTHHHRKAGLIYTAAIVDCRAKRPPGSIGAYMYVCEHVCVCACVCVRLCKGLFKIKGHNLCGEPAVNSDGGEEQRNVKISLMHWFLMALALRVIYQFVMWENTCKMLIFSKSVGPFVHKFSPDWNISVHLNCFHTWTLDIYYINMWKMSVWTYS